MNDLLLKNPSTTLTGDEKSAGKNSDSKEIIWTEMLALFFPTQKSFLTDLL